MIMKPIAIHFPSFGFAPHWAQYCEENAIPYVKVDCYDTNIIDTLKDCSALMWHCNHESYRDGLFAKDLIQALAHQDILIYPNAHTLWHFNDKLAQKYLLESLEVGTPRTEAFYDEARAIEWAKNTSYPFVFKLRAGAGSTNVKLVNNLSQAKGYIRKAFGSGYPHKDRLNHLKDRITYYFRNRNKKTYNSLLRAIYRYFIPTQNTKLLPREKGYVIFQEFMPKNEFDTRLIVIGNKCFGIRRYNRKNDFRASGSGLLEYNPEVFDKRSIALAFKVAKKLQSQSLAIDLLFDRDNNPVVVELSFAFPTGPFVDDCPGYWDDQLNWHAGHHNLPHLMVEELLQAMKSKSAVNHTP